MGGATSEELHANENQNFLKLIAVPTDNLLIATTCVQSPLEFSTWASALLKFAHISNNPILLPLEFKIASRYPCGEQSLLEIKYECFYIAFAEEVERRMQEEKHFEEEELWYLLLTLVEAAEIAHQLDSRLGDVKPSNLLLNKQGQIKMLTRFSLPTFLDSFSQESPKGSLFSPEELESRRKAFKLNKNNYILCESFSIGMTMLAAGALSKVSLLYNYQQNELNTVEFNKLVKYWEEFEFYSEINKRTISYSHQLKAIVISLLRIDPARRMASLQLRNILQNYRTEIMTLEKFVIDERFLKGGEERERERTHRLKSRQKSEKKDSVSSSIIAPTFNNSHDVSFQLPVPNASSEFYISEKKRTSRISSVSNKQKLSVTAYFQERE